MPPRRTSSRAASAKPASKPVAKPVVEPASRPAARSRSQPAKRAASADRAPSPAAKRQRTEVKGSAPAKKPRARSKPASSGKPLSKTKTTITKRPRVNGLAPVQEEVPQMPYFNPIPTAPDHTRPAFQIFAWGTGNFGQFGMGSDFLGEFSKPKKNAWIEEQIEHGAFGGEGAGLEAVAAGGLHTLLIDEKGTVWSCGANDDAALGRITKDVPDPNNPGSFLDIDESVPHPIQTLVDEKFRAVRVAAGDSVSAAISAEGELRVWGSFRSNEGPLGFAEGKQHQFTPVSILELAHKPGDGEKVVSVASGNNHLLILTTHGTVFTLGAGEWGQLGRKVLERRKIHGTHPEKIVLGTRSRKAVIIGAGNYHSFAVDDQGVVWGWGLNTMGQTGTGMSPNAEVPLPSQVIGLSKKELGGETVVEIAGGDHHTLFLTSDGKVYACGRSNGGQLGLPEDDEAFKDREYPDFFPEPLQVKFPDPTDRVIHISAGTHSNVAVTEGGALYSWGEGNQGELGIGEDDAATPTVVVRKEGGSWRALVACCGGQHTIGLFRKKN